MPGPPGPEGPEGPRGPSGDDGRDGRDVRFLFNINFRTVICKIIQPAMPLYEGIILLVSDFIPFG